MPRKKKSPATTPSEPVSNVPAGIDYWLKRETEADSHVTPETDREQTDAIPTINQIPDSIAEKVTGDTAATAVLEMPESGPYARNPPENRMAAKWRWGRENRLADVERWMGEERSRLRDTGMARHRANDLAWEAALVKFPPPGQEPESIPTPPKGEYVTGSPSDTNGGDSEAVAGLGLIPGNWPTLPNNSSLQAELGWVQAERLRVVEQRGNVTRVRLELASTPAPSMAALSWLETSIRSYAKYVDVVARALSTQQDEQEHVRRERMRLDDIRALLDEMHRDQG